MTNPTQRQDWPPKFGVVEKTPEEWAEFIVSVCADHNRQECKDLIIELARSSYKAGMAAHPENTQPKETDGE